MRGLLLSTIGFLAIVTLVEPALADGFEKPQRATSPARAARPAQQAQPQQQSANWNGSQAGGSNGSSSVNNNFVEPGAYNCSGAPFGGCYETPFEFSSNKASYIIGAFYGYRQQMGNYVVGVEGDLNWKNGSSSKSQNYPPPWLAYEQFTGSQKQGVDGSIRVRAGVLVTPFTLVYATGGLAIGQVSGTFSYFATQGCCNSVFGAASWSDTRVGGTVGGGVETAVGGNVKVRAEYRYTTLGKFSKDVPLANNFGCLPGTCGSTAHIDLKATNQRFLVGVGFDLN